MKRTLALLLVAAASSGLAQTPTVVEKPVVKSTSQAKAVAKTPAPSSKPSPAGVKVVSVPAQPMVKPVAVPAAHTSAAASAKPVAVAVPAKPVAVPTAHVAVVSAKPASNSGASKFVAVPVKADPFKSAPASKNSAKFTSKPVAVPVAAKIEAKGNNSAAAPATVAVQDNKADNNKQEKAINTAGRRDPFVSPVVNLVGGSGCSSGKRCLAIDQVALRGVVKSDSGMIAVVVNAMDKAYFLHENDPVFNGYVLKITGDSIVFKETFHDKLGKPLTRDVTKTITKPVA